MKGTGAPPRGATFVPIVPPELTDNGQEALKRDRLMAAARAGDPGAIDTLWREYHLRLEVASPGQVSAPTPPRRSRRYWQFTCPACGTTQTTTFRLKGYCSRKCRVIASRRRTAAAHRETGKILSGGATMPHSKKKKGPRA